MIRRKLPEKELHRGLHKAFRDDLPADAEKLLRAEIHEYWLNARLLAPEEEARDHQETFGSRVPDAPTYPVWGLSPASVRMAAVGLSLLILAWIAPTVDSRSVLAESLSVRHAWNCVLAQVRRSEAMRCSLEMTDQSGRSRHYLVEWAANGETTVRIEWPEGKVTRSLRLPRQGITLFSREKATPGRPRALSSPDPLVQPVQDFLTPDTFVNLLASRWEGLSHEQRPDGVVFTGRLTEDSEAVCLTADRRTYLPTRLEFFPSESKSNAQRSQPLVRAQFQWKLQQPTGPGFEIRRPGRAASLVPHEEGEACLRRRS